MAQDTGSPFADQTRLLARLSTAIRKGQKISFLIGSALTLPAPAEGSRGVAGIAAIVKKIEQAFVETNEHSLFRETLDRCDSDAARYQEAMQLLLDCQGQEELNRVIREAVLEARLTPTASTLIDDDYNQLELESQGWELRPAVKALGELISLYPKIFSEPTLTSNFDPLAEISIRAAGSSSQSVFLSGDGLFDNVSGDHTHRVIHFHGYWRGSDTLHTPHQLKRERPRLEGSLRDLLRKVVLVVIGYGGWEDIFTRTLLKIIAEERSNISILWCFYTNNDREIFAKEKFMAAIQPALGQRLVIYKGIDCHDFLPQLVSRIKNSTAQDENRVKAAANAAVVENKPTTSSASLKALDLTSKESYLACDTPPSVDAWVGREGELATLTETTAKVIAITGIGGQGKSTIAARYLRNMLDLKIYNLWDWRDLREEPNTAQKQLISMIFRVTNGGVNPEMISGESSESLIKLLFDRLGSTPWLFVLDNIDHYIEPDNAKATMAMHELISMALKATHSSRFIFTCRPNVSYEHEQFLQIKLPGLSFEEAEQLFMARGVMIDAAVRRELHLIHQATDGHPLWMTLIATQVAKSKTQLQKLSAEIQRGKVAGLPRAMLRSIWETLSEKQQYILRYMAELIRPEREEHIAEYVSSKLNWNQFSRQLKSLRTLNLVVVKSLDKLEKLDLHPLIREFVREEYSSVDRREFIGPIIKFFEGVIVQLRPKKDQLIGVSNIEKWTVKTELELNLGQLEQATDTLMDAEDSIISHGFHEEFIRLAEKIISALDWSSPFVQGAKCLKFIFTTSDILVDLGRFAEADILLNRVEHSLPGKTAAYIGLCTARSYLCWSQTDYTRAIYWGEQGVSLRETGITTSFDSSHNLALARRDSGNIEPALVYFLKGHTLSNILSGNVKRQSDNGTLYGNIGRCLFKRGDYDDALTCYVLSYRSLSLESNSTAMANQGYAHLWIGEALERKQSWDHAYIFYMRAAHIWRRLKPSKANEPIEKANRLFSEHSEIGDLARLEEWTVEHQCQQWFMNFTSRRK